MMKVQLIALSLVVFVTFFTPGVSQGSASAIGEKVLNLKLQNWLTKWKLWMLKRRVCKLVNSPTLVKRLVGHLDSKGALVLGHTQH